jgi:4-carboxymuconolactone decarboxylase
MRVPLLRSAELTAEQQALYRAFDAMGEGEEYAGFQVQHRRRVHRTVGVMLHFPELARSLASSINLAQELPGLSEPARQVVILAIAARFNVAYEMYAHARLASRPEQVATLCAGGRPPDLTEEEVLATDVATAQRVRVHAAATRLGSRPRTRSG